MRKITRIGYRWSLFFLVAGWLLSCFYWRMVPLVGAEKYEVVEQCWCYCAGEKSSQKFRCGVSQNPKYEQSNMTSCMNQCNNTYQSHGYPNAKCRFLGSCSDSCDNSNCGKPAGAEAKTPHTVSYCHYTGGSSNPGLSGSCMEVVVDAVSPGAAVVQAKEKVGNLDRNNSFTAGSCKDTNLKCHLGPEPAKPDKPIQIPITDPGTVGNILSSMNPLKGGSICGSGGLTIGCILSYIVNNIIFPLSTIFLLLMIIWGGYKIVSGSMVGAQNAVQAGKQRLIGAILGFILLASVYWIWQLIEATTQIHIMKQWW